MVPPPMTSGLSPIVSLFSSSVGEGMKGGTKKPSPRTHLWFYITRRYFD